MANNPLAVNYVSVIRLKFVEFWEILGDFGRFWEILGDFGEMLCLVPRILESNDEKYQYF